MSTTILGLPLYYPNYTTSTPSPKAYNPSSKSYGKGLRLPTPFSHREQVDQHIPRCSPPELPFTDSPPLDPILWIRTEDPRTVSRLSLREARARQATCLEAKNISMGTATCSECLSAPLGSRTPQGAQFQGPQVSTGSPTRNSRVSRPSVSGTACACAKMLPGNQVVIKTGEQPQ